MQNFFDLMSRRNKIPTSRKDLFEDKDDQTLDNPPEFHEEKSLEDLENSLDPHDDYYAILNVARDASPEEIKSAYKRLSMLFHPDKHVSQTEKDSSENQFHRIQHAYEVLSDPNQRTVYDEFGEEGLDSMKNWQVGPKLQTQSEIRTQFELNKLKNKQAEAEMMIRATSGQIELSLNSAKLFSEIKRRRYRDKYSFREVGLLELLLPTTKALQITQSTEINVFPGHSVSVSGLIVSRGGRGGGYVLFGHDWQLGSRSSFQTNVGLGSKSFLGSKYSQVAIFGDPLMFGHINAHFARWPDEAPPNLEFSIGRVLGPDMTGNFTYRTGDWNLFGWGKDFVDPELPQDSIELSLQRKFAFRESNDEGIDQELHEKSTDFDTDNFNTSAEVSSKLYHSIKASLNLGIVESGFNFKYDHRLTKASVIQFSSNISTSGGISATIGAQRTIMSSNNKIGVAFQSYLYGNMLLKIKFTRFAQTLSLPILLSDAFNLNALVFVGVLPVLSGIAINKFILIPKKLEKRQKRYLDIKQRTRDRVSQKRQEALDSIELMKNAYDKKVSYEREIGGLVILDAFYGFLRVSGSRKISENELKKELAALSDGCRLLEGPEDEIMIDVKIPLQILVSQSQLILPKGTSKSDIIGFYDPCPWQPKKVLMVRYEFRSAVHEVIIRDKEKLMIPLRAHAV